MHDVGTGPPSHLSRRRGALYTRNVSWACLSVCVCVCVFVSVAYRAYIGGTSAPQGSSCVCVCVCVFVCLCAAGPWDKHVQEELRPVVLACQDLLSAYDDTLMAYQFKL